MVVGRYKTGALCKDCVEKPQTFHQQPVTILCILSFTAVADKKHGEDHIYVKSYDKNLSVLLFEPPCIYIS